jgi:hypothetical protein
MMTSAQKDPGSNMGLAILRSNGMGATTAPGFWCCAVLYFAPKELNKSAQAAPWEREFPPKTRKSALKIRTYVVPLNNVWSG